MQFQSSVSWNLSVDKIYSIVAVMTLKSVIKTLWYETFNDQYGN